MKNLLKNTLILVSGFALVSLISTEASADSYVSKKEYKAPKGVYMQDISLAGMDENQIKNQIDDYAEKLLNDELDLKTAEKTYSVSLKELGVDIDKDSAFDKVTGIANSGNIVQKYLDREAIKANNINVDLAYKADKSNVESALRNLSEQLTIKPVNGGLKRNGSDFTYIPGKPGQTVDVNEAADSISQFINNTELTAGEKYEVPVETKVVKEKGTREELSEVRDLLGTATTNYTYSNRGRVENLSNGVSKINGSVIYPGEVFSVFGKVSPFTEKNGYHLAGTYSQGEVIQSYGGGICQVSSTLYNAVLAAELEVVERAPHSMLVSYLPPGKDAAIAGTYKDLKFKNNMDTPIYVEGRTGGGTMTFSIYGKETRPSGRKVRYESEIVSTKDPEIKYVAVAQPVGYQRVASSPHIGKSVKLWKIVTENGEEKKTLVSTSTYRSTPKVIEIGTKSDVPEATAAVKAAIGSKDKAKIDAAIGKWKNAKKEEEKSEESKDESEEESVSPDHEEDDF